MIMKKYTGYIILMMICCFFVACDQRMDPVTTMMGVIEEDLSPPDSMMEEDIPPPDDILVGPPTPLEQAQQVMFEVNDIRRSFFASDIAIDVPFIDFQTQIHLAYDIALLNWEIIDVDTSDSRRPFQDRLLQIWMQQFLSSGSDDIRAIFREGFPPEAAILDNDAVSEYEIFIEIYTELYSHGRSLEDLFPSVEDISVEDINTWEITRRHSYVELLRAHDPILTEYLRLYYQYPEEDGESILQRFKESMAESMATGDILIDYPDTYDPDTFGVIQEDTSDALQEEVFLLPAEE